MKKPKSSLIVSPNLGCPEIVSAQNINEHGIRVIIAAPSAEDFDAKAHTLSACQLGEDKFDLELTEFRKLEDESLPLSFADVGETRLLISTTLRTELFPGHSFWAVRATPKEKIGDSHLRKVNEDPRSTLYDLALRVRGVVVGRVRHALCLRADDAGVKFIHLTDPHVAARNDIWQAEVKSVIQGSPVTPGPQNFQNFNERLREFIRWANQLADQGQLDFVFALGDLVDFSRTGLFDRTRDDSNWSTLIDILIGSSAEKCRGNEGLRVPLFTTTGNHDWRTFPYSPVLRRSLFGITKDCANELDFWYRNTSVEIGKKLEEVNQKLMRKGSPLLARSWWGAIASMNWRGLDVGFRRLGHRARAITVSYGRQLFWTIVGVGTVSELVRLGPAAAWHNVARWFSLHHGQLAFLILMIALGVLATAVVPAQLYAWLRKLLEDLLAIEAEVGTISEYLLRVNPYFNYAFQLDNCYFIVLDTGPDCLTAQSFWDDGGKKVRNVSLRDNIIGGSPDTMGFYPANEYYRYGQITWLENVLACVRARLAEPGADRRNYRIFAGLHAPPANLSVAQRKRAEQRLQINAQFKKPYVPMKDGDPPEAYDIHYGTVNHYVSQFFYLCLGYRECEQDKFTGPGIDVVFAGHAHWIMEFQLLRPADAGPQWCPQLWYGKFSVQMANNCHGAGPPWGPLLLQTAACGPASGTDADPPNFRYVTVDRNGDVCHLRPCTLRQPPHLQEGA